SDVAYPQLLLDAVQGRWVHAFYDVDEDEVKGATCLLQRRHGFPHVETDDVVQTRPAHIVSRVPGKRLVPNRMVHLTAAVLGHRPGKPGGRVAEAGPQLKDAPGADHAGDLIAYAPNHRADDGEALRLRPGFHLGQHGMAVVGQLVQVRADRRVDQLHAPRPLSHGPFDRHPVPSGQVNGWGQRPLALDIPDAPDGEPE